MNEYKLGDCVRYEPAPDELLAPYWAARAYDYDSVIVDMPGLGRPAYGMAAVPPAVDRWFAVPGRLVRA